MERMEETTLSPAKPAPILGKHPFFFIQVLFLAYGSGLAYCIMGVYREGSETLPLNPFAYYLGMAITFMMGIVILVIAHKNFRAQVRPIYLIGTLVYFVMNLIAILTFPDTYIATDGVAYQLSLLDRVHDILLGSLLAFGIYLFFAIFPQCLRNETGLDWALKAYLIFVCLAIAWSLYAEWDHYLAIFEPLEEGARPYEFRSFASHKNAYGFILLLGIFAAAVLQDRRPHWWRYLLIVLFGINILLSFSKTSLTLALLFLGYFLLERFIRTVKKHPVRNLLSLGILAAGIGAYFAMVHAGVLEQSAYFTSLKNYVEHFGDGPNTLDSRMDIWERVWGMVFQQDRPYWVYGYGVRNFPSAMGYSDPGCRELNGNIGNAHNAFLEALATNGVFVVGFYVLFYLGIFVTLMRSVCHRHPGVWPTYLAFFVLLLMRFMVENDGVFLLNVHSFLIDILWTWPILAKANTYRTKSRLEQEALNEYCQRVLPSSAPKSRFAVLLIMLLSAGALSACLGTWGLQESVEAWQYALWISFAVIYFLGWILSIAYAKKKFFTAIIGLLYAGIAVGLAYVYHYFYGNGNYVYFALILIGLPLWGFCYAIPFTKLVLPPYFAFVPEAERKHNANKIRRMAKAN